jgi:tuberous sclerosis protein 2
MRGPLCDNCWAACKSSPDQTRSSHSSLLRASSADGNKEDKLSRQSSDGHASSSANTAANSPTEENKQSLDEPEALDRSEQQQSESYKLEQMISTDKQEEHLPCACWCQGWAEIYVRRPTGDMSWIMRIQNSMNLDTNYDLPLDNITALYMPTADMLPQKSQDLALDYSEDEIPVSLGHFPTLIPFAMQLEIPPSNLHLALNIVRLSKFPSKRVTKCSLFFSPCFSFKSISGFQLII